MLIRHHSRLQSWALIVAVAAGSVAVYAAVRTHSEAVALRAEVNAANVRGCPGRMQGKAFAGSRWLAADPARPKFSTLQCYYQRGVVL